MAFRPQEGKARVQAYGDLQKRVQLPGRWGYKGLKAATIHSNRGAALGGPDSTSRREGRSLKSATTGHTDHTRPTRAHWFCELRDSRHEGPAVAAGPSSGHTVGRFFLWRGHLRVCLIARGWATSVCHLPKPAEVWLCAFCQHTCVHPRVAVLFSLRGSLLMNRDALFSCHQTVYLFLYDWVSRSKKTFSIQQSAAACGPTTVLAKGKAGERQREPRTSHQVLITYSVQPKVPCQHAITMKT